MSELRAFNASESLGHVTQKVRYGASAVASEILAAAADQQADLIVLSARRRGGLMKLVLGCVTEEVLRIATVDVLTIPPTRSQ
jgi:nucleotide-binding universal stress UspA family protein